MAEEYIAEKHLSISKFTNEVNYLKNDAKILKNLLNKLW